MRPGGPDVVVIETADLPPLADGEALVRVSAAGLNHVDSLVRTGAYSIRFPFPYAVGVEGSGTVVDVGAGVSLSPGTRVCWTAVLGSCATYVVASARMLASLPEGLSFEAGASLAHAAVTAAGLIRHYPLHKGSAVVWGAAGAVGRMLVALLADRGVSVIGIASGARTGAARQAGAACVVDRLIEDVVQAVRDHTNGRGVEAVFDPIGAATYETSLGLLAPRGCLVNFGQLSGALPAIDLARLMDAGSVFVTKYGPRARVIAPDEIGDVITEALALATKRRLATDVAGRFTLDRVAAAYRALESNPAGKILVFPHGL
jgi:NADPH2:quinone reductase